MLIILVGMVLLFLGISAYVVFKYRVPLKGIAALGGAVAYVISPVDIMPEAILGPLGLTDDLGLFTAAMLYAKHLGNARRALSR